MRINGRSIAACLLAMAGSSPLFADVSVAITSARNICKVSNFEFNSSTVEPPLDCPDGYYTSPLTFNAGQTGHESYVGRCKVVLNTISKPEYTVSGVDDCPSSTEEIVALIDPDFSTEAMVCDNHNFGAHNTWQLDANRFVIDSASCSEITIPSPISAQDDEFSIELDGGPVTLDVLANDTGDDIEVIDVTSSSNGGTVSIVNGSAVQYTPPDVLPDNFVDTFNYTVGMAQNVLLTDGSGSNTAQVTVNGPGIPPPPETTVKARNDEFQVIARDGRALLDVLSNDTPANKVRIGSAGGDVQGRLSVSSSGTQIVYDPPLNLIGTIVENFNYNIIDKENNALRSRATVRLTVIGTQASSTSLAPSVPTSSIGKIKSELPVARAVENLCDLLTFRATYSASRGRLSDAQRDLQICTCAIVNEGDAGTQRNAINQLSGGQHQFSDTVMRFAKGNASAIIRRMTEIRKRSTTLVSPTSNALASPALFEQLVAELPRHYPSNYSDTLNKETTREHFSARNQTPNQHGNFAADSENYAQIGTRNSHAQSVFNSFTLGKNSVYFSAPLGGSAGDADGGLFGDQVGVFTSVTTGSGDNDEGEFNFDFDSYDITTGIDYTRPGTDRTRVYGGALSIGKVETDSSNGGNTNSDSMGITLYGSLFKADGWFADGVIGYSKSDIDIERVVNFTASGKTVLQTSSGDTKGDELSLSVSGGKEINLGANNIRADARLRYINGSIDGLTEQIGIVGANGSGLALQTDDFDITSFRSELGLQFNRTIGTGFGVVIPFFSINWIHEFEDRGSDIRARFVVDAYSDGFNQLEEDAPGGSNRPTLFLIPGSENDSDYAQLSVGSSFAFKRGRSAWISLSSVTGLSGISNDQLTAGFRWELGNK